MKNYSKLLFLSIITFSSVLFGESYIVITEDMTKDSDWLVNIEEGCTNDVKVTQTNHKIIKQGKGTLILSCSNSVSGIDIDAGYIYVGANNCLGFGTVTIAGQRDNYSGPCGLRFSTSGVTNSANVVVTGNTTLQYPAFFINSSTNAFLGNITANYDFAILEEVYYLWKYYYELQKPSASGIWSQKVKSHVGMSFEGEINVLGKFHLFPDCRYLFKKSVRCNIFETILTEDKKYRIHQDSETGSYGEITFYGNNEFNQFVYGYRSITFHGENSAGGAIISNNIVTSNGSKIFLNGKTNYISSCFHADPKSDNQSAVLRNNNTSTLIITGTTESAETYTKFSTLAKLRLDCQTNPDYSLTLINRNHDINGILDINNGTLVAASNTSFVVREISIGDNGKLLVNTTGSDSVFTNTTKLVVNGEFVAKENVSNVFPKNWLFDSIYISTNAKIRLNENLITKKMYVNNKQIKSGTYTSDNFPNVLTNFSVTVTEGSFPDASQTAEWIGGDDEIATTMLNWKNSPHTLPLTDGSLKTVLVSGKSIKIPENVWFNSIVNEIDYTNSQRRINTFMIESQNENIVLNRGIYTRGDYQNVKRAQLFLKGHFKLPYNIKNADEASSSNIYAIRHYVTVYEPELYGMGAYEPYQYSKKTYPSLPLVLSGVILDIPLYVSCNYNSTLLNVTNDTINILNSRVFYSGSQTTSYYGTNSVTVFCGGLSSANCHHFYGPGTIEFNNNPIFISSGMYIENDAVVIFNSITNSITGNNNREGLCLTMGTINCITNNCFEDTLQIFSSGNDHQVVKLNQTTQHVGNIYLVTSETNSYISGDCGSLLRITGNIRKNASTDKILRPTCSIQTKGCLSFHYNGTNSLFDVFTLSKQNFESCGDLIVSQGTMQLDETATWLNGTNFIVNGSGILKFTKNGQVNKKTASLHISDNGMIEIADNVTLRVNSAEINGESMIPGKYDRNSSIGGNHIIGNGTLKIGSFGTIIIMK